MATQLSTELLSEIVQQAIKRGATDAEAVAIETNREITQVLVLADPYRAQPHQAAARSTMASARPVSGASSIEP